MYERLEEAMWGGGYRIALSNLRARQTPYELEEGQRHKIVRALFPEAARVAGRRVDDVQITC